MITFDQFIAIIAAIGGISGITSLIVAWSGRRKVKSEAADIVTDSVTKLLDPLNKRIDDQDIIIKQSNDTIKGLTRDVHNLQMENAELRAGVALLSTQIVSLGQTPLYQPKKREG